MSTRSDDRWDEIQRSQAKADRYARLAMRWACVSVGFIVFSLGCQIALIFVK